MDRTIDAQPFLGQLVGRPDARGLFSALSLLGMGVTKGDVDLTPYSSRSRRSISAMADALAGHPQAAVMAVAAGRQRLNDLAGKYTFVLVQPKLDFGALQPGGEATDSHARHHRRSAIREVGRCTRPHHRAGGAGR